MLAEELGEPHRLGALVGADPLEDIVLGHLAAGRQRAAPGGDRLDLAAQRDLGVEQRIAGGPVFGALVREGQMLHGMSLSLGSGPVSTAEP